MIQQVIGQEFINLLVNTLNLEKISVIQKYEILCYPKNEKEITEEKLKKIKEFMINKDYIDIKIVSEGEIVNEQFIEFQPES